MESLQRTVVHLDIDSFFVSVEVIKNPKLEGKPVIIGGSSDRGVVASCSYEARKFGVHSAMSSKLARRICPHAIWIKGDYESYVKFSSIVTDVIAYKAPMFEKASIDEFYMDISGMDKFFGSLKWTQELTKMIFKESHLPVSFGISANKTVSKVATGEAKPKGELFIEYGNEKRFLAPLKAGKLPMIGQKTGEALKRLGVTTIGTLSSIPIEMLEAVFGQNGKTIWLRANGIDNTPVLPYTERKSISTENTFQADTIDVQFLKATLIRMVEQICFTLRKENYLASCITVKLRYSNFDTETKQARISYTGSDDILIQKALELFNRLYSRRMLVRLIGVRLSDLVRGSYQINLFEDTEEKISLYQAMDKIRSKYGKDSIHRAVGEIN